MPPLHFYCSRLVNIVYRTSKCHITHRCYTTQLLSCHRLLKPSTGISYRQHLSRRFYWSKISGWIYGSDTSSVSSTTPPLSDMPVPQLTVPDVPTFLDIPTVGPVADIVLNVLGEPTFNSLGLSYTFLISPLWWCSSFLESLHVSLGLPWWTCAIVMGVSSRLFIIPFMYMDLTKGHQRVEVLQKMTDLMKRYNSAKKTNDFGSLVRIGSELRTLFEKEKFPIHSNIRMGFSLMCWKIVPMFVQFAIFFSVFRVLNNAARLPVESLQSGGLGWFVDLTCLDPYFVLPLTLSAIFLVNAEYGIRKSRTLALEKSEKSGAAVANNTMMENLIRCAPLGMFIFTCNFPAMMSLYMCTTMSVHTLITILFQNPAIRDKLSINKEATLGFKDSMGALNSLGNMAPSDEQIAKTNEEQFKKAKTMAKPKVLPRKQVFRL